MWKGPWQQLTPWLSHDELILLWLPSALHASCFVMRQEEEGEQVIQGLQGAGHQQVRAGAGWEGWAGRQGAAPSPLHRSSRKGGLRGEPASGTAGQPQGTNGGAADFAPTYKVWHRD